jgi:enoyl-CoA hydratase/carnithine racemase
MSWSIERHGRVAVVTMTTNPVNAQNRAFFADLHDAFDRLEQDHPDSPVVLTGQGGRFSTDHAPRLGLFEQPLDRELPTWMTSDDAQRAHRRYWRQLKGIEPAW